MAALLNTACQLQRRGSIEQIELRLQEFHSRHGQQGSALLYGLPGRDSHVDDLARVRREHLSSRVAVDRDLALRNFLAPKTAGGHGTDLQRCQLRGSQFQYAGSGSPRAAVRLDIFRANANDAPSSGDRHRGRQCSHQHDANLFAERQRSPRQWVFKVIHKKYAGPCQVKGTPAWRLCTSKLTPD